MNNNFIYLLMARYHLVSNAHNTKSAQFTLISFISLPVFVVALTLKPLPLSSTILITDVLLYVVGICVVPNIHSLFPSLNLLACCELAVHSSFFILEFVFYFTLLYLTVSFSFSFYFPPNFSSCDLLYANEF